MMRSMLKVRAARPDGWVRVRGPHICFRLLAYGLKGIGIKPATTAASLSTFASAYVSLHRHQAHEA